MDVSGSPYMVLCWHSAISNIYGVHQFVVFVDTTQIMKDCRNIQHPFAPFTLEVVS